MMARDAQLGLTKFGKGCLVVEYTCLGIKIVFYDLVTIACIQANGWTIGMECEDSEKEKWVDNGSLDEESPC